MTQQAVLLCFYVCISLFVLVCAVRVYVRERSNQGTIFVKSSVDLNIHKPESKVQYLKGSLSLGLCVSPEIFLKFLLILHIPPWLKKILKLMSFSLLENE